MNFARDQFLAGATFAQNQGRGFGGSDEINLTDDVLQRVALADQLTEGFGLHHFFLQVSVLHLELCLETLDFLERPRVGDGSAEVIGENPLPGMSVFREAGAGKNDEHSQHFASKRDGRCCASPDFFRQQELEPGKFSTNLICILEIGQTPLRGNPSDKADAQGDSFVSIEEARELFRVGSDVAFASGHKMQATRLIGTERSLWTTRAKVALVNQPDFHPSNFRAGCTNRFFHQPVERALLGDVQQ